MNPCAVVDPDPGPDLAAGRADGTAAHESIDRQASDITRIRQAVDVTICKIVGGNSPRRRFEIRGALLFVISVKDPYIQRSVVVTNASHGRAFISMEVN